MLWNVEVGLFHASTTTKCCNNFGRLILANNEGKLSLIKVPISDTFGKKKNIYIYIVTEHARQNTATDLKETEEFLILGTALRQVCRPSGLLAYSLTS